ncbi:hypothetical protein [Bradyrhizobium sp. JR3.5]
MLLELGIKTLSAAGQCQGRAVLANPGMTGNRANDRRRHPIRGMKSGNFLPEY